MKTVRCAIYTRKSSDEGLEQAFNSLDAQREACAAYILSQASEGWTTLPDIYDDGGLSGGTLERPALRRLLAEVAAGRVDIIVVYKVDRLTRSLFDFAKLVETFDKAGTSFVSVTQSFNTTTSMGRLTLNMLLSFAQFEREVTAERIRDKIAASKAKGMWMGGTPPLGYQPDGRSLAIVEEHAALIRHIVVRYLHLGTVSRLERELASQRIVLPVRERSNGTGSYGGGSFTRGQLYKILANPIYIGRIPHGDKSYAGRHPAIIDTDQWDAVQAKLADNRQGTRGGVRAAAPSLLAGKVVDAKGEPLIAVHASRGNKRYRYYVSRALHHGTGNGDRVPAREFETAIGEQLATALDDPLDLAARAQLPITPATLPTILQHAPAVAAQLRRKDAASVQALVRKVTVHAGHLDIELNIAALADLLQVGTSDVSPATITLAAPVTLTRTGRVMRLVGENGMPTTGTANPALLRLMIKARRWWRVLREGQIDVTTLAAQEGVQPSYVTRVVRLAFLSPAVTAAALRGELRAGTDIGTLTLGSIPASWQDQAAILLPSPANAALR